MAGENTALTPPTLDLGGLLDRIGASAERITDLRTQLANELEQRDRLIVDAYDHAGHRQREIAGAAGITIPQITRVLSRSSED